jgi:hypothetical protein
MPLLLVLLFLAGATHAGLPLARQAVALDSGVSAGMAMGFAGRTHCNNLWNWQGQIEYAYTDWASAGASLKFYGGKLDSGSSLVYQRYSLQAKFIRLQPRYALFFGPIFSFDNTDLSALRNASNNTETRGGCAETFGNPASSVAYHTGGTYLFGESWAALLGHTFDITFDGEYQAGFSLGLAFDLHKHLERFRQNTQSAWLSAEANANFTAASWLPIYSVLFGLAIGF